MHASLRLICVVVTVSAVVTPAAAEPVFSHLRVIAPAAPGGGWDQTARAMQQVMQTAGIAATVSVENVPGAAGTIGLAHLIGAEHGTGGVAMISGLIMLGATVSHRSAVTLRDATPIARLTGEYEVVVVPAASPYRTLSSLLEAFRARPESISWAGGSAGGTDQILAGLIADTTGVPPRRVNYVAFAGGGESIAAILGGQVTAGISGLAEYAPQIAAGTVRILAISSAERLPGVDAPTLREQGVDVVLENWRSIVAPPGIRDDDRERLQRAIAEMVRSAAWKETLQRYQWNDRYLAGPAFAAFVASEEARVQSILDKFGTAATDAAATQAIGLYPKVVAAGLIVTGSLFAVNAFRNRTRTPLPHLRAAAFIGIALAANVALIERAGFVLASIPLFWLTARAFDERHPMRDAAVATALSLVAYLVFARLLQIELPAGFLAGLI
jgi:putative tricarboxylic transport membrane protein